MARDDVTADVSGLQLSNSTFSASPPGSLARADECVMPQKGVIEPRPGQARRLTLPTAAVIPFALTEFENTLVTSYSQTKQGTSYGLGYDGGAGSITAYTGTFNPVDTDGATESAARMKFAQANDYLHFCTTTGPRALELVNGQPRNAGLLRQPDPVVRMSSASNLGTIGVGLEYGYSRAYRTVLRKPTSNGTDLLSPPSGRQVIQNRILAPIGSMVRVANVVTVTLPGVIDPGWDAGDTFTIDPGEGAYPGTPAVETVSTVTANVMTYADVAADDPGNTLPQDLNTGQRPVVVVAVLSEDATTATPVRIYRSRDTITTDPDDEMFLIAEIFPSAGDITNGFVAYLDVVPQSAASDPLYTNKLTGGSSIEANLKPPIYRDVANWAGSTWYANTTGLQQLRLEMIGVGSPDGVQNNDTITIAGEVFTFKTTPAAPGDVQIVSNGTYSFNTSQTTQFLIEEIFEVFDGAGTDIRAYYEGTNDVAPGRFLLEAIAYDEPSFTVSVSRQGSWSIALPATSKAETLPNNVSPSKPGQPESVPALNLVPVGSKSYPIGRIIGLRQSLLVFKEGDGIWSISGAFPYSVQQISTANIIARDTACSFADAAWAYTDQGFLRISDAGGVTVVSRHIETKLNELFGVMPAETRDYSFCVPYEQARRLLLFVPVDFYLSPSGPDIVAMSAYCYNNATQAWTGPLYDSVFSGAAVTITPARPQLALGTYDAPWVTSRITLERVAETGGGNSHLDYLDESFAVTLSEVAVGGDPLVVRLASITDVEVGDLLIQAVVAAGIGRQSVIAAIRDDLGPDYVELYEDRPWTASGAFILKHYDAVVQFQPQGDPSARKSLKRLAWLFKPKHFCSPNAETIVSTDQCQEDMAVDSPSVGFGLNPFGSVPFGDPSPLVLDVNPLDPKATTGAQFSVGIRVPVAAAKFKLQGVATRMELADAPVGRGR